MNKILENSRKNLCLTPMVTHQGSLPYFCGLDIKRKVKDGNRGHYEIIAHIKSTGDLDTVAFIETVSDKFQTYVVTWEDFQDFIMLVDEAYRLIEIDKKESRV